MKSRFSFLFIVASIIFQAAGGILGKYVSITIDNLSFINIISNTFYTLGLFFMIFQAIVWQQALKHYQLSFAYPFMSLTNFVILISAYMLFDEKITLANIIGLSIISYGIYLLAKDRNKI